MISYEWVDRRGDPVLAGWDLEPRQWRQLKVLLIQLDRVDYAVANGTLIFKTRLPGIYYSKINGNVALRPRCCIGPELNRQEYQELKQACQARDERARSRRGNLIGGKADVITYLERVQKRDDQELPSQQDSQSPRRMAEVASNHSCRQRITFHVGGTGR